MTAITRLDFSHVALALGTLLLCAAVVQGGSYVEDAGGVLLNNRECEAQTGPPGQNGNCSYPEGTCYLVSDYPDIDAVTSFPYFQIRESRAWGYCSAGSVGGYTCTKYPTFSCAKCFTYNARSTGGVCQQFQAVHYITVGADACNPAVGGP